jgi:hypothetical protein
MSNIREFIDIIEEGRRAPVGTLYHLTRLEKLDSIRRNGLQPSFSSAPTHIPRTVNLSGDIMQAGGYAANFHRAEPGQGYVLLAIDVEKLDPMNLAPNDADLSELLAKRRGPSRQWSDLCWRESLKLCNQCGYRDWIKTENISVVGCMQPGQGWKKVEMPLAAWSGLSS